MSNVVIVKRNFIDVTTGQLHLRAAGEPSVKPAIICLHMMPKSGRGFAKLMPELAKDRLVLAPDYPGYGESDHFPDDYFTDGQGPTIADYADSIIEVIKHYSLERVQLVGYHTGSLVAVELASRYPELVEKLINISAPIMTEQEVVDFKKFFAPVKLDKQGTRFQIMWERVVHFSGPGMTLEMAATSMAENLRGGERYEDGHYAAFDYAQTYTANIAKINQPLLVMNLGDDLFEHTKRVDSYLKNGNRVDYPDWGHGFLELWPQQVASQMLDFFETTE